MRSGISSKIQIHIKKSSSSILLLALKIFSGFILGLTFSLVGDEIINYGQFVFIFVIITFVLAFLRLAKNWSFVSVLVFDLVCVLVGMLLRLYIVVAPGT